MLIIKYSSTVMQGKKKLCECHARFVSLCQKQISHFEEFEGANHSLAGKFVIIICLYNIWPKIKAITNREITISDSNRAKIGHYTYFEEWKLNRRECSEIVLHDGFSFGGFSGLKVGFFGGDDLERIIYGVENLPVHTYNSNFL